MDVVAAMEWTGTVGVEVNGEIFWSLFWISRFGLDRILLHLIGGEILGILGTLGTLGTLRIRDFPPPINFICYFDDSYKFSPLSTCSSTLPSHCLQQSPEVPNMSMSASVSALQPFPPTSGS